MVKSAPNSLLPCQNALEQHTFMACYPKRCGRCSLDATIDPPNPEEGYGWKLNGENL